MHVPPVFSTLWRIPNQPYCSAPSSLRVKLRSSSQTVSTNLHAPLAKRFGHFARSHDSQHSLTPLARHDKRIVASQRDNRAVSRRGIHLRAARQNRGQGQRRNGNMLSRGRESRVQGSVLRSNLLGQFNQNTNIAKRENVAIALNLNQFRKTQKTILLKFKKNH